MQVLSPGNHLRFWSSPLVDYTIYTLDEGDLSLSNGTVLDGMNQGDGSHLVGETLTINVANYTDINITDNDNDFDDNDGNQRLNGDQEIDGVTYTSGTRVEAEYSFVVSDGTNTWTLIGFNVDNSNPTFGTVEGIAVIGGPGGFPPVGVPLTIASAQEGPSFPSSSYASPICFVSGTLIDTPEGPRAVETLSAGDVVTTYANGPMPIMWTGSRDVVGIGSFAPVRIRAGMFGNAQDLVVSQQHRILIEDWRCTLLFGEPAVFAHAEHLVNGKSVVVEQVGVMTYHHLLFKEHQIVFSNSLPSESLLPGPMALATLDQKSQLSLVATMPEIEISHEQAAVRVLKRHETELLMSMPAPSVPGPYNTGWSISPN